MDSDNAVAFLLDLRGQLETLGGPAKAKGGLSKAEKSSARDELWKKYANIVAPGSSPAEPLESINSDGSLKVPIFPNICRSYTVVV